MDFNKELDEALKRICKRIDADREREKILDIYRETGVFLVAHLKDGISEAATEQLGILKSRIDYMDNFMGCSTR